MIYPDYHLHTDSSPDGHASAAVMARTAVRRGLTHIALTDHWEAVDYARDSYASRSARAYASAELVRQKWEGTLYVARGIELGSPLFDRELAERQLEQHSYDFVLASQHQIGTLPDFCLLDYGKLEVLPLLDEYFEQELRLAQWNRFHALAHLTYPLRYIPAAQAPASYARWSDLIDAIFRTLIENGKALEINTSGLRKAIRLTQPELPLIRRYRELHGELITFGSDAHRPEDVGAGLDTAAALAAAVGFRYVTRYIDGRPEPVRLTD